MPLIVITGIPCSGKTKRAQELERYFANKQIPIHLISESVWIRNAGCTANECFTDTEKEKQIRASLKSETMRLLTKNNLVILDAANYIKGYRYEIYCVSKNARTTQCTVYCEANAEQAKERNGQRTEVSDALDETVFDALCMRYEEPLHSSRWDRPLFSVHYDETMDVEGIDRALYQQAPLVPNLATQNAPLSSTNFLFELDLATQTIIDRIMSARKLGVEGPVEIPSAGQSVDVPAHMGIAQLNRCRRQFINYIKLHSNVTNDAGKIPSIFVQYLNANVHKC